MNMIRTVLIAGSAIYIVLFMVELFQGHVLIQAIIGALIMITVALLPFFGNGESSSHDLHNGEMTLVWICILLFGFYAILKTGGII